MQSGLPDLKFPEFLSNSKMIRRAREIAGKMIAREPQESVSAR
jgi:RecG-like helicase